MLRSGMGMFPAVWGAQATWHLGQTWKASDHVLAEMFKEPFWFLGTIGVIPEEQRKGYGSQMIQPICNQADQSGVACVSCLPDMACFPFFETWGFEVVKCVKESNWGAAPFIIIKRVPQPI